MSSYLNIYLVPKRESETEEKKHLLLCSYCRNNDIYDYLQPEVTYAYKGDGTEELNYTELAEDTLKDIVSDITKTIQANKERIEINYRLKTEDSADNIYELQDRNKELQDTLCTFDFLLYLLHDIKMDFTSFESMEANVD